MNQAIRITFYLHSLFIISFMTSCSIYSHVKENQHTFSSWNEWLSDTDSSNIPLILIQNGNSAFELTEFSIQSANTLIGINQPNHKAGFNPSNASLSKSKVAHAKREDFKEILFIETDLKLEEGPFSIPYKEAISIRRYSYNKKKSLMANLGVGIGVIAGSVGGFLLWLTYAFNNNSA